MVLKGSEGFIESDPARTIRNRSERFRTIRNLSVALLVVAAVVLDLRRSPSDQVTTRMAVGGIHLYQATLSPLYGRLGADCRFDPTCSHYGEAVIKRFGIVRGGWMATKRVFRCGPWTPAGTKDSPPV